MHFLTLGRLERIHAEIGSRLGAGDQVLDLGCGTGALAARLAREGAQVTAIDSSPRMLAQAQQRIQAEGLEDRVTLLELGAVDLDTRFPDSRFDAVTSTLVLSELSNEEIDYALAECWRLLRPEGRLFIADEVMPRSASGRLATYLIRLPFAVLALVLAQITTHPVAGLEGRMRFAGFTVRERLCYLAGTLQLYVAERVD